MRIALLLFAVAACTDTQPSEQRNPPLPPPSPLPQARLDGARPLHMRNCPSGVPGSVTTAKATDTGIDVAITADSPDARARIVALATASVAIGDPHALRAPGLATGLDSGHHTGAGDHGFCPVIHAGTALSVDPTVDGAIIHERPYDPGELPALRAAVVARVRALSPLPPSS